ncbi:ABC transporter ATP-binding protein [Sphingomonas changnyeongensis]|uniref:ABC transporter ATP-binding protein n=1 Tax=Sphingomonas changnyeongensis TaxID=2698679 RepID=UPI001E53E0EF|nr:ABC transporter ATP-binding protein [Sphingomonas changnyeongensis]
MTALHADALVHAVGGRLLVDGAHLRLGPGELVVLLGPNGAGKTTLLRLALGLIAPSSGSAMIGGTDARQLPAAARARHVAYLPQGRALAWPARVRDVVALGRFAFGGPLGRLRAADGDAVARALAACDLVGLADRRVDTLSGGELARVHIARALAAEAPLIIADEPAAALDPLHQHQVMAVLRAAADRGGGVLVVLHDLALAARYADRLVWMQDGRIVADGPVAQTLTRERVAAVYGVSARIGPGPAPISASTGRCDGARADDPGHRLRRRQVAAGRRSVPHRPAARHPRRAVQAAEHV